MRTVLAGALALILLHGCSKPQENSTPSALVASLSEAIQLQDANRFIDCMAWDPQSPDGPILRDMYQSIFLSREKFQAYLDQRPQIKASIPDSVNAAFSRMKSHEHHIQQLATELRQAMTHGVAPILDDAEHAHFPTSSPAGRLPLKRIGGRWFVWGFCCGHYALLPEDKP